VVVNLTITVFYLNGTTEVYTGVTAYANSGGVVSFTGKLGTVLASWEIDWASVKKIQKDITP
jgi:hypothetical protein